MNETCPKCGKYTIYYGSTGTGEMCNCQSFQATKEEHCWGGKSSDCQDSTKFPEPTKESPEDKILADNQMLTISNEAAEKLLNYVDSLTPEQRAKQPDSTITTSDQLWEIKFDKEFNVNKKDWIPKIHATAKSVKDFIRQILQQERTKVINEIREMIRREPTREVGEELVKESIINKIE